MKMETQRFIFKMPGTDHPSPQRCIAEDQNPQMSPSRPSSTVRMGTLRVTLDSYSPIGKLCFCDLGRAGQFINLYETFSLFSRISVSEDTSLIISHRNITNPSI